MVKVGKNSGAKKLARKQKQALRAEADKVRFQRSDRKSLSELDGKSGVVNAITPAKPLEDAAHDNRSKMAANAARIVPLTINHTLAQQSAVLLSIAAGIGFLLGAAFFGIEGGHLAVRAIGGVLSGEVPIDAARVAFTLDTLFPVFFGSGLAVLVTSLQSRGNRPLVRLILTALLVAVSADFVENALAFKMMMGEGTSSLQWVATVVKYAGLAFAGLMVSAILPIVGFFGTIAHLILRYVFPVAIALLVSGIGGELVRDSVGASFPISLLILAIYAAILSDREHA